ncbi:MAG: substrate-binding domain-containing protein [Prevotella sp.]|jgi:phosphate transport system substrate-binding protein|uniref:Substrate-binding domain-containing protein n=1 Tax=Segatella cerevisiae TaxID=2053716 RepID=A0ABT1BYH0_9BACT|nr:substrate-binding domain-containing protein [Segatella cerevisiae]MCH3994518.1 substrate-binding domain-containing protein [Prevotella sp.]MCI1245861.1 substrate-binding domain-containing protein [Prevotella sp.]MCO6026124.1 substrate-binding domain-containing protein [Segatella cerevisiae]
MKKEFRFKITNTLLLFILIVAIASCGPHKRKDGRTDTYSSGVISFASDESFSPIVDEEREVFESLYPKAKVKPIYTDETDAVNKLMQGKIYLVITSRDYSKKEYANLKSRRFMPVAIKLAYDGLALIVNKNNTDTCLTIHQIKDILTGKISNWKQINPRSRKGTIQVVFDRNGSSAVNWCVDSLLKGKPFKKQDIMAAKGSKQVIDYVQKTAGAIGIIGSNWLNDEGDTTNTTFKKNITVVSVSRMQKATPYNSWKPYQYYLYNGNYPLIRTIYALLNDPLNALPWGFAHFIESPQGQMIIYKTGLLPMNGDITVRDVNVNNN